MEEPLEKPHDNAFILTPLEISTLDFPTSFQKCRSFFDNDEASTLEALATSNEKLAKFQLLRTVKEKSLHKPEVLEALRESLVLAI